jgi:hypothetical protein
LLDVPIVMRAYLVGGPLFDRHTPIVTRPYIYYAEILSLIIILEEDARANSASDAAVPATLSRPTLNKDPKHRRAPLKCRRRTSPDNRSDDNVTSRIDALN